MAFIQDRLVYFSDTDGAGVVFFAQVLTFCHDAYEASLGAFGLDLQDFFCNSPLAFPVVNCQIDFHRPIYCGELLQIEVTGQPIGLSEFVTFYQIKYGGKLKAKGSLKHCAIDRASRRPVPLPQSTIDWLSSL